jgi:hypothetical protein
LLHLAAIQCSAQLQLVVAAVGAFGTAPAKQARVAPVVVQDHQVQTVIDLLYLVVTVLLDKDSQAELVVDSIVKAIINMPVAVVAVQVRQDKMPVMKDMNIMRQTAALA